MSDELPKGWFAMKSADKKGPPLRMRNPVMGERWVVAKWGRYRTTYGAHRTDWHIVADPFEKFMPQIGGLIYGTMWQPHTEIP